MYLTKCAARYIVRMVAEKSGRGGISLEVADIGVVVQWRVVQVVELMYGITGHTIFSRSCFKAGLYILRLL